ncbi:MAG: HAD family hydrolase [Marinilabiliales bacterium]|nr:MAG: HAD family hydrolase [Marinilabiliales bacterium]
MKHSEIKAIIWDWNGTLLNDVDICVECMNQLLHKRNIKPLTKEKYLEIFTFPVKEYYENAGFDFSKEKFEVPALQFIDLYHKNLKNAKLHTEVIEILKYTKSKGIEQYVLSAMQHDSLIKSLNDSGIYKYFKHINGIDNHYAHSKVEIGLELIKKIPFDKEEIIMVGDTLHDESVAKELGVKCVLIAKGHQSKERLNVNGSKILDELGDLKLYF